MKFLLDNAISPIVCRGLVEAGHDAIHVREYGMQDSEDEAILRRAAREHRVLISSDTDFGTLLARRRETRPSLVLLRRPGQRRPQVQLELLLDNLPRVTSALRSGSIVVLEEKRLRIRALGIIGPPRRD